VPIEQDGARSAYTMLTTKVGPRQPEFVAQEISQRHARLGKTAHRQAIHAQSKLTPRWHTRLSVPVPRPGQVRAG